MCVCVCVCVSMCMYVCTCVCVCVPATGIDQDASCVISGRIAKRGTDVQEKQSNIISSEKDLTSKIHVD